MAKGSQLSQLKSALSQAGITRQPQSGKKRKRSGAQENDKDKKAAKLSEIHQKLNPFDVKVTKLKHDVGGRKLKGVTGKPAQSKQHGIEQRKKTLLKEFEEKGRSGGIVDRRFGENDPTMTPEERMLERFTKERQRSSRGAVFNLEDDDELTHYGQSLSKLDDFDDVGLGLDDEEEVQGQIDGDVVKRSHFGGFGDEEEDDDDSGEPARKKSKAEVMAEVIAKSKEHKLRRQMEREQDDNIRHQLDQEFDSIRSLLYAPDPSASGSNSIPLGGLSGTAEPPQQTDSIPVAVSHAENYDQHVRELAFDKRAKPKDRTKTEEEIALEEKEALEKAERRRKRRMLGEEEGDSDEEDGKGRGKRKREVGGDDLEDDFDEGVDGWSGLGAGLEEVPNETDDESQDANEEDDASQGSNDFDTSEESEVDGGTGNHEDLLVTQKPRNGKSSSQISKELPFTFPCPGTHGEFLEIVEGVDDKDVPTVVQRIRTLYHPSLGPDNKFKLQALTTILIDHILHLTSTPSPHFSLLTSLMPHLFALTRSYPIQSAQHFAEKLSLMHKNLKRGLSRGALDPSAKTWPGVAELSLLRVIGIVWPTSDMNHAVISPARLLMGAYLGLGRIRSLADIGSGLFLSSLFLEFEQLSKRLVPEAVNFVTNTVLHLAPPQHYQNATSLPGSFPSPDFRSDLCRPLAVEIKKVRGTVARKPDLVVILANSRKDEQEKMDLLGLSLDLLGRFADLYKGLDGFVELYQPIHQILQDIEPNRLVDEYQKRLKSLIDTVGRLLKFSRRERRPLLLQAHKPIPIPSYIPKFDISSSSYLRRKDPDHERNEAAKLRNQYKQERKGAIRELRKDARFLAGVEQKKQREKDQAYKERMKRVFGSIEGERAEEKAMEREKMREKRRSGRK